MFKRVLQSGICCLIWLSLIDPLGGQTQTHRRKLTTDIKEIVLENRLVSRKFAVDNGWLRTSHLVNLLTGENILVSSPEFEIQLENEPVLSSQGFVAEYYTHVLLAGEVKKTLFTFTEKRQRLRLELEYTLGPNDFFVRKRARLYALQKSLPRILSISVEALKVGNIRTSFPSAVHEDRERKPTVAAGVIPNESFGQPVFLNDSFFWGTEHPAGRNRIQDGIVRCTQYPGNRVSSSGFESYPVVAGVSPRGEVAEWFFKYVDTFHLSARQLTILRIPGNHSGNAPLTELLERKAEALPKISGRSNERLVDGLVLGPGWWPKDALLPLDGSSVLQSLSTVNQTLRSRGLGLGLYFPLSSTDFSRPIPSVKGGVNSAADASSNTSEAARVCLADPKYKEALKSRLKELHQGNPLRFIRHDLDRPLCQSALHGHGVEADVSYQAATEALIDVLRFERSLDSNLYLSLAGGELPSPWWLQYANDVGTGDLGQGPLRMDLSPRPRDWRIQREGILLQDYFDNEHFQFPLSRLARTSLQPAIEGAIAFKEPQESWADAVAEYLGRGQDLTELRFDPEQLDSANWDVLRRGLEWKVSRHAVFRQASIIGGAAANGEPYGYLHWNTSQAIAVLHNPSPSPHETSFHLPKTLRGPLRIFETYPRCRVESQVLKAGDIVNTSLEGLETRVLEVNPEGTWNIPLPQDSDFVLSSSVSDADEKPISLRVFPETSEVRFSQPQRAVGLQLGERPITLDPFGRVELPDDAQTSSRVASLKSFSEKKAEVGVYAKRGAQLTLPDWSGVRSSIAIWLLQPEEQRRNFPLYVTLDRKQVDLTNKESFIPSAETRTWNHYSLPLKFERQVLLDWAIKDVKDVSLYLWWEIVAPRPALEFTYRMPSGRVEDAIPPLLSSPRGSEYVVRIPLEVDKPHQSGDTP